MSQCNTAKISEISKIIMRWENHPVPSWSHNPRMLSLSVCKQADSWINCLRPGASPGAHRAGTARLIASQAFHPRELSSFRFISQLSLAHYSSSAVCSHPGTPPFSSFFFFPFSLLSHFGMTLQLSLAQSTSFAWKWYSVLRERLESKPVYCCFFR